MNSIYWHDYETWGSDSRRDRPCQFAGIRTDEDLNIISDPLEIFCEPQADYLPDPEACLITGISPQTAVEKGVSEVEFCNAIMQEFAQANTCVAGYNSIRFDDEVSRHLFYRCFFDPYEREWKNGNSRWDIIDLVRLTYALRPEGIEWPLKDSGKPSFRLEDITIANNLSHESAHDAVSDVRATIEVAKLIRSKQPRLYEYYFQKRFKQQLIPLLDLHKKQPVVHVSGMFPAEKGCMAIVMPLILDPHNNNGVIVCDLSVEPEVLLELEAEEISRLLFTPKHELPENTERPGLKTVHVNRCPAIAPLSVINDEVISRFDLDLELYERHRQLLLKAPALEEKITRVFSKDYQKDSTADPDLMLYTGGFFSSHDKQLMHGIRQMDPQSLAEVVPDFSDKRLAEMLFRYRARNFPDTLAIQEKVRWKKFCTERLSGEEEVPRYQLLLDKTRKLMQEQPHQKQLLVSVEEYIKQVCNDSGIRL